MWARGGVLFILSATYIRLDIIQDNEQREQNTQFDSGYVHRHRVLQGQEKVCVRICGRHIGRGPLNPAWCLGHPLIWAFLNYSIRFTPPSAVRLLNSGFPSLFCPLSAIRITVHPAHSYTLQTHFRTVPLYLKHMYPGATTYYWMRLLQKQRKRKRANMVPFCDGTVFLLTTATRIRRCQRRVNKLHHRGNCRFRILISKIWDSENAHQYCSHFYQYLSDFISDVVET